MDYLDLISECMVRIDPQGLICGFNRESEIVYGLHREAAIGRHFQDVLGEMRDSWLRRLDDGDRWHGDVVRHAHSQPIRMSLRWAVSRDQSGKLLEIIETGRLIDLPAERHTVDDERSYRDFVRSEADYRHLFDVMGVGLLEHDFTQVDLQLDRYRAEGVTDLRAHLLENSSRILSMLDAMHVTAVNDQALRIFGVDRRDQDGLGLRWLWPEDSYDIVAAAIDGRYRRDLMPPTETQVRRRDGSIIDVSLAIWAEPERLPGQPVITAIVDISDRVAAQQRLERVRADFAHASRISTVGELTGSIAHEVSQPLSAIVSNAVIAERILGNAKGEAHEQILPLIQHTIHAAKRATGIVARIRSAAASPPFEPEALEINDLIGEALQFVRQELVQYNIRCQCALGIDLPHVLGDRIQIQQVIVNLVMNAIQAMSDDPAQARLIDISTWEEEDRIQVRIEDNGHGIAPDYLERVFDSFYTTKSGGMGIGLAVCRSIVEQHSGTIAASTLPRGARFEVSLPAEGRRGS